MKHILLSCLTALTPVICHAGEELGISPLDEDPKADTATVCPKQETLKEVVVTGRKMTVKEEGQNYIISNIQGSSLADAGTILDMMAWTPGITLDASENIQVFGTNGTPLVYINGVKVTDMTKMKSLSSNMVKRIEVIRDPGAQYPVGTGSVIKITTIVPLRDILNGNIIDRASQSHRFSNSLTGNVFGTFDKVDVMGSLGYMFGNSRQSAESREEVYSKSGEILRNVLTNEGDCIHSQRWQWLAGVTYRPTNDDVLQIEYSGGASTRRREFDNERRTSDPQGVIVNTNFDSRKHSTPTNHSLLGSYTHDFDGSTLEFMATYNSHGTDESEDVYLMPENTLYQQNYSQGISRMWTLQGDYSWKFRDKDNQRVGLYGGKSNSKSENDYTFGGEQNVTSSIQWFEGYLSSNWDIRGYGLTFGVRARYEHQKSSLTSTEVNSDYDKEYFNVVPNVSLFHRFSKKFAMNLSYKYTYVLPTFAELSPATTLEDLIFYNTGNPDLKVPRVHNLAIVANLPSISLIAEYKKRNNQIVEITTPIDGTEYFLVRPENMSGNYSYSFQVVYNLRTSQRWRLYVSGLLRNSHVEYYSVDELVKRNRLFAMAYVNVNYNILPNLDVFGTAYYASPQLFENITVGYSCNLSFGANMNLLHNKLSLRLMVNDVLAKSVTPSWSSYSPYLLQSRNNYYDTRNVTLTATYKFTMAKKRYSEMDNAEDYDRM